MSLIPCGGNDVIYTPVSLAKQIVEWVKPSGTVLEPCAGGGVFVDVLTEYGCNVLFCEIMSGTNFFNFTQKVDWIITNPPWSDTRRFMLHAMELSNNIVFLITVNHVIALKARIKDIKHKGFWMTKCLLVDTPKEFPQSGFQLGACLVQKTDRFITEFYFS